MNSSNPDYNIIVFGELVFKMYINLYYLHPAYKDNENINKNTNIVSIIQHLHRYLWLNFLVNLSSLSVVEA